MDWNFDSDVEKQRMLADQMWRTLRDAGMLPWLEHTPGYAPTRRERWGCRLREVALRLRLAWRVLRYGEIDE